MDIPFLCPVCNNEPETILHALRDCPKAQSLWNSLSLLFQCNLFYGLQLALKLPAVIVELDSKLVVDLLNKELDNPNGIDVLVTDCRESLKAIPCIRIQHCYREANKCADALARRGALLSQDFSILIDPPPDVAFLLSLDSARALYDRFVPSVLEAG